MAARRPPRSLIALGIVVLLIVVFLLVFQWDWLIPIVESRASAALGRPVTLAHLHVHLGRVTRIVADDVVVADPAGFPGGGNLATIDHLGLNVDVMAYIHDRTIKLPSIDVNHPVIDAIALADGKTNYAFPPSQPNAKPSTAPPPQIGDLSIEDGHAHVVDPKLKADFNLAIATREPEGKPAQLVVDAKGTYAAQPITGHFVGGALLSLRDATNPYPIDLHAANGPTHVAIVGTVQNPLSFAGANIKLDLAGPNMALLLPLTGIPLPETPPFHLTGNLDYANKRIRFTDFTGTLGRSDLNGNISVDPGPERPDVVMDLNSHRVDLKDLGGLIGATPGERNQKGETAAQRSEKARAVASPKLLPDTPINMPRLRAADLHVKYRAGSIEGRSVPFDNLIIDLDIVNGAITLHPVSFGVGSGHIAANMALTPVGQAIHAKGNVDFQHVDVSSLMAPTGFKGAGLIGGNAQLDATGRSLAQMLGSGNGDVKLFMSGGDLSALLVSLSGLQFGNALANALGIPNRADLRCMLIDLPLNRGVVSTRLLLIDTTQSNIRGTGTINLNTEALDYQLRTTPKHFSIGSLPAPIDIRGSMKSPSILPDPTVLAERGAAAVALGVLLTPLGALIPTIQLGLGKDNDCNELITQVSHEGANRITPAQIRARTGHR